MCGKSAIFMQGGDRQHARQHMRGRPEQDRRDVDGVKPHRRHAERARSDRHKGAYRRHEAGEEYRQRAPAIEERLALRDHARIIRHRPLVEDFALAAMSDPERGSVAEHGARDRGGQHPFQLKSPPGTSALSAKMMVEPGTTEPTTGTASSRAARNSVR